jgi:hypothetical protein
VIGLTFRNVAAGSIEILSVGPLWVGLVLRGVWLSINSAAIATPTISFSLCANRVTDAAAHAAGVSLITNQDTGAVTAGQPNGFFSMAANVGREILAPVYAPITDGPKWVGVAVATTPALFVWAGLICEPERLQRPAMDHGKAARFGHGGDGVMERLRIAAEAARA